MSMSSCFCEKCGAQVDPANNFCESCGAPVHDPQAAAGRETRPVSTGAAAPPAGRGGPGCPKCGQADRVTAVFSLYEKDQLSVDNYDAWLENTNKDEDSGNIREEDTAGRKRPASLAEKLAPPEEPKYASGIAFWAVLPFIPVLNAIMVWFAPVGRKLKTALLMTGALLVIALILQTRAEKYLLSLNTAYYSAVEEKLAHAGPFTVLDAPFLAGFLFLVLYYTGLITENARRKAYFRTVVVPAYNSALARWRKLYYCSRCDGVYAAGPFPGKPAFVPADRMRDLLYEKIPRYTSRGFRYSSQ